jgi:hypothetical protein
MHSLRKLLIALPRLGSFVIAGKASCTEEEPPCAHLNGPQRASPSGQPHGRAYPLTFATLMRASEPLPDLGCRSSGSCSVTVIQRKSGAM